MLETLPTVVGAVLIVGTLRDVVHELFHPEQTGSLSRQVMHGVWRTVRKIAQWRRNAIFRAGGFRIETVPRAGYRFGGTLRLPARRTTRGRSP